MANRDRFQTNASCFGFLVQSQTSSSSAYRVTTLDLHELGFERRGDLPGGPAFAGRELARFVVGDDADVAPDEHIGLSIRDLAAADEFPVDEPGAVVGVHV